MIEGSKTGNYSYRLNLKLCSKQTSVPYSSTTNTSWAIVPIPNKADITSHKEKTIMCSGRSKGKTNDTYNTDIMTLRDGFREEYTPASKAKYTVYKADVECDQECVDSSSDVCQDGSSGLENSHPFPPSSDDGYDGEYSDTDDFAGRSVSDTCRVLFAPSKGFSNSKTWVSEEETARVRYQRCMADLHHMGCDDSPFIPASFEEWISLKADYAERRLAYARRQLCLRLDDINTKRIEVACGGNAASSLTALANKPRRNSQDDTKSTVLGLHTIWHPKHTDKPLVYWPPYKEFKMEGDGRVKGHRNYGRRLPLPKLRKLTDTHHRLETDLRDVPTEGPRVPYDAREIDTSMTSALTDTMSPCDAKDNGPFLPTPCLYRNIDQISLDDHHYSKHNGFIRELIEDIDNLE